MADDKIASSEITPESTYLNRRAIMRGGVIAGSAVGTAWLYRKLNGVDLVETDAAALPGLTAAKPGDPRGFATEEAKTAYASIT